VSSLVPQSPSPTSAPAPHGRGRLAALLRLRLPARVTLPAVRVGGVTFAGLALVAAVVAMMGAARHPRRPRGMGRARRENALFPSFSCVELCRTPAFGGAVLADQHDPGAHSAAWLLGGAPQ
jgi:hypothetical protein